MRSELKIESKLKSAIKIKSQLLMSRYTERDPNRCSDKILFIMRNIVYLKLFIQIAT